MSALSVLSPIQVNRPTMGFLSNEMGGSHGSEPTPNGNAYPVGQGEAGWPESAFAPQGNLGYPHTTADGKSHPRFSAVQSGN